MIRVSVSEAKEKLEELIAKAAQGETVEITSNGHKATLQATLISQTARSEQGQLLGSQKGILLEMSDDFNEPLNDFNEYMP